MCCRNCRHSFFSFFDFIFNLSFWLLLFSERLTRLHSHNTTYSFTKSIRIKLCIGPYRSEYPTVCTGCWQLSEFPQVKQFLFYIIRWMRASSKVYFLPIYSFSVIFCYWMGKNLEWKLFVISTLFYFLFAFYFSIVGK